MSTVQAMKFATLPKSSWTVAIPAKCIKVVPILSKGMTVAEYNASIGLTISPTIIEKALQVKAIHAVTTTVQEESETEERRAKVKAGFVLQTSNFDDPKKYIPTLASELKRHMWSLQGWVAGMPDHQAKQLADLEAREREVIDSLAQYTAESCNPSLSAELRKVSFDLAEIEAGRLNTIRNNISLLIG